MGWIWRKGISVGKKVLAAGFVMASAPFLIPPLVVASTIALISSLPYCIFLVGYVCTEKLMRKLLPATAFGGTSDKMVLTLQDKIGHGDVYDERMARVAMSEPTFLQTEEEGTAAIAFKEDDRTPLRVRVTNIVFDVYQTNEDMRKESRSLLESIRDDDRTYQSFEKAFGEDKKDSIDLSSGESEKVGAEVEDLSRKKKVSATRHEGVVFYISAELAALSNVKSLKLAFMNLQALFVPVGEREASTTKAPRVNASSNEMKVLYDEEQIWAKMEALRKIVGYSVARSTTYSEELKALYMFMGVDFPTTMLEKENQDIAQVSERLHFLMSVIGIN